MLYTHTILLQLTSAYRACGFSAPGNKNTDATKESSATGYK